MTPIFADTFYFLALLSRGDREHAAALRYAMAADRPIVTTAWVLTEVADGLAPALTRPQFLALFARLDSSDEAEIVGPSADLWRRGIDLYARRPDKDWSLTDCISFVVMTDRGISEALTGDHHFEQAGFVALLK
jgi:predicted nucleic acid-binding protein